MAEETEWRTEYSCERCGGDVERVDCESCGGEGLSGHDCGEDVCCCLDDSDNVSCDICDGRGFWRVCGNSETWCNAHPLPGREDVKRGLIRADRATKDDE